MFNSYSIRRSKIRVCSEKLEKNRIMQEGSIDHQQIQLQQRASSIHTNSFLKVMKV